MLGKDVLTKFKRLRYTMDELNWNKEINCFRGKDTGKNIEVNVYVRDYTRPNYKS